MIDSTFGWLSTSAMRASRMNERTAASVSTECWRMTLMVKSRLKCEAPARRHR